MKPVGGHLQYLQNMCINEQPKQWQSASSVEKIKKEKEHIDVGGGSTQIVD
jgi:predicted secreted protein